MEKGFLAAPADAIGLPYFTEVDPKLARQSGARDPLGLLPIWSDFGRRLVPNIASPVFRLEGVKAVLLIHWWTEAAQLRELLASKGRVRGFFRLAEGLIEYWLFSQKREVCFGSQALIAGGERFSVRVGTGKTVANGLHQYYRGTCARAGFVDDAWRVEPELANRFATLWSDVALRALADACEPPLTSRAALVPAQVLTNQPLANCLKRMFADPIIHGHLQRLFGGDEYYELAGRYAQLKASQESLRLHERVAQLSSDALSRELDYVRRCEPFLMVMQDVFDLVRAVPGRRVADLAIEVAPFFPLMKARAEAFAPLGELQKTRRMNQMQQLATILHSPAARANQTVETLDTFVRALVNYHGTSMRERGRDPIVVIEDLTIVLPTGGEGNALQAKRRLQEGYPWLNDYYLNTAASLYNQLERPAA